MLFQRSAPSSPCLLWKSLKAHFCFKRLQEEYSGLGALFPELGAASWFLPRGARAPSGPGLSLVARAGLRCFTRFPFLPSSCHPQFVQAGRKFPVPNPWSWTGWLSPVWLWMCWSGLGQRSSKVQQTRSRCTKSKDIFVVDAEGLFSLSILETLLFVPEHSGYGASCRL